MINDKTRTASRTNGATARFGITECTTALLLIVALCPSTAVGIEAISCTGVAIRSTSLFRTALLWYLDKINPYAAKASRPEPKFREDG